MKPSLKEKLKNMYYAQKACSWANSYDGGSRSVSAPSGYSRVFYDTFTKPLNLENWRYAQPWGWFHPDDLKQYYDTDGSLTRTTPSGLVLELRNDPVHVVKSELPVWQQSPKLPDEFIIPTGIGLITSKLDWQYGWFEAWIQLPEGSNYWPSFWLTGKNSWPPEIDILEAFSNLGPRYDDYWSLKIFGKKPNKKLQPNLHWGVVSDGTKECYGSYNVPVAECSRRFVQYVCHWERDFIRIYYDSILAFETTDKDILKWFNRAEDSMYIVLGHGRYKPLKSNPAESDMKVRSFSVYKRT